MSKRYFSKVAKKLNCIKRAQELASWRTSTSVRI